MESELLNISADRKVVKAKTSDQLCEEWEITNVEVDYEDSDYINLSSYKLFGQYIRPIIAAKHPKLSKSKIMALIAAKWREFCETKDKRNDEVIESTAVDPSNEEVLLKTEMSGEIGSTNEQTANSQSSKDALSDNDTNVANEIADQFKSRRGTRRSNKSCIMKETSQTHQRRSSRRTRSRKVNILDDDSDEEFEAMLRIEEGNNSENDSSQTNKKKVKKPKEPPPQRVAINRLNKPKQEDENDTDHQDFCDVCRQGGEIMLCDGCPRAFHLVCVDPEAEEPPDGDWFCPICVRDGINVIAKPTPTIQDNHIEYCRVCKDGGELLCCDRCPNSYHMHCIVPCVKDIPEGEWICPRCSIKPPKVVVKRILTWKWSYPEREGIEYPIRVEPCPPQGQNPSIDDEKAESRRIRELLVKYDGLSYWHCEWLPELVMEVHQATLWRCYWKRLPDRETLPHSLLADDPNDEIEQQHLNPNDNDTIESKYVKYGIRPEWLMVHRIVNNRKERNGMQYYLVKWRDLPYDQSTYEPETGEYSAYVKDWQKHIDDYWKIKQRCQLSNKKRIAEEILTDPKKKYDRQPNYIDDVGGTLHEYQLEGLNWLRFSWAQNTDVILADEMGLGKTVQTISFLYSLFKENLSHGPFLISAPLSTIINWEREFEFWAPDMYVVTYTGDRECRSMIRKHEFCMEDDAFRTIQKVCRIKSGSRVKFHVLLTSYELVSVDSPCLSSVDWEVLVVDEAHRLKNNQSKFFRTLTDFSIHRKVLLTGTPLQNNLEELYHLLNFLSPVNFNDMTGFLAEFSDISKDDQVKKLHNILGPHLLRRLKSDVLSNMPSKSEFIVRVEPSPMQKKYYQYLIHRNYEVLTTKSGGAQPSLLNLVMELKKCCNHPYLLQSVAADAPITQQGQYEGTAMIKACGKLELLAKMLPKLKLTNHRMTRMMDILEDFLDFMGYKYERIDGKITGQERQDAIDRFNAPGAEQFAFLLSTRSGGLGINLATADTVVIYDSDWNPHNDIQVYRAHRIGQQNKVMIYRFVTRDTVEERICQVAKRKMMLTHLIVRPGVGRGGQNMSKKELEDILRFGTENLFKANEKAETEEEDKCMIHYDDEAIEQLLDRSQLGIEEKECSLNEYLSSFKVASYLVRDEAEDDVSEKEDEYDNAYWEKLIGVQHTQFIEEQSNHWGKGKRSRRQVNYAVPTNEDTWNEQMSDAGSDISKLSLNEDEEDYNEFDDKNELKRRRGLKDKGLSPLITKVNGTIEVLGFNVRQRKAFLNAVMRYGLPPEDMYNSQWLVRDLRQKSDRELKAYTSLFLRHMCEPPNAGSPDCFMDGVPREGLSRQQILSRIGVMSLIRKKVVEFEQYNMAYSMPELRTNEMTALDKIKIPVEGEHEDGDVDMERENKVELGELVPLNTVFNIADGGFTEIHSQWQAEDKEISTSSNKLFAEREIWNKSHDYWLLVGIVTHGHSRWQDIQSDIRFSLINEPFKKNSDKGNFLEVKNKFLARRYKLLEQGLVVEEQLRRASFLMENNMLPSDYQNNDASNLSALLDRYSEIETLVETFQPLTSEIVTGNPDYKPSNMIIQKVLCQIDELLSEMKNDINKLPSVLPKINPISERLCMSEKGILSSLLSTISKQNKSNAADKNASDANDQSADNQHSGFNPKLNPYYTYPLDRTQFTFMADEDFDNTHDVVVLD